MYARDPVQMRKRGLLASLMRRFSLQFKHLGADQYASMQHGRCRAGREMIHKALTC